ncbi:tyrosine-type recombinase/integrase [Streptomyces sp. NPDC001276]|uniref:tyrosine-type recombinase/integrase n=1 Tax=Streptomyces sp. NPDC001276 TaxID=3364555 RepID=UPI0036C2DCB7
MAGYIEDRWFRKDSKGNRTIKTALHGTGKRYKVTGIPGVRSRSFPDKQLSAAKAWLAKAQAESDKGEFIDPRAGDMLLREYVEEVWWPAQNSDPATLETIRGRVWNHILPHLGGLRLRQIKVATLRPWLKDLEGAISPGTAGAVWGYLSNIFEYAIEDEKIPKNPCKARSIKAPKPPEKKARAWTRERVMSVQSGLPGSYRILVDIGAGAGLRQGEALGLAVEDIDEEAGVLHVRRQVKRIAGKLVFALPKNDKTRTVPLPDHLALRIREHMRAHPPREVTLPWGDPRPPTTKLEEKERAPRTHQLLVTNSDGGAVRAWSFNQHYWKPALSAAGVIPPPPPRDKKTRNIPWGDTREHGFHCLRHTFASVQLDARESVVSVSKWLGHADPAITLRVYAHFMPEADGRGRRAMDSWFTPPQREPLKISLDSPWVLVSLPGEAGLKGVKFPSQAVPEGGSHLLDGAPVEH